MVPDEHADAFVPGIARGDGGVERRAVRDRLDLTPPYGINLRQQRKLGERSGGRFTAKTHFLVAGGQVSSMLSWLAYMKHGEPQQRVFGLRMPPPNLKPDFKAQAKEFVDGLVDGVQQPTRSGGAA